MHYLNAGSKNIVRYLRTLLKEVCQHPVIQRQRKINQLQRLTYPLKEGEKERIYPDFPFKHTRFDHAKEMVPRGCAILLSHNFPLQEVVKFALAILTHDAFTAAGGDASMRLSVQLCEVKNYLQLAYRNGLQEDWKKFRYNAEESAQIITGKGKLGVVHEALDKHGYTKLDVRALGENAPEEILLIIKENPDVWEIVKDVFITDKCTYFLNPCRLYNFLLVRALMHSEFYLNPMCRKLEHLFFSETRKLFQQGIISITDLQEQDDRWLDDKVRKGKTADWCTMPQIIKFARFETREQMLKFCQEIHVFHTEKMKEVNPCIDWLVFKDGRIMPLHDAINKEKIDYLESIAKRRQGWYAYFK